MKKSPIILCFLFSNSPLSGQARHDFDVNSLCGVDQFARTFNTLAGNRENRYVGMFYFLWLGQHPSITTGIYDITKIFAADSGAPYKNLFNLQGTPISPYGQFHFWGEPLYGYYNSLDEYVMRKHIELLTAAGVDFLVFDVTNASSYDNVWLKLFSVLDSYRQQGWNVPKVAFYTNSYSEATMKHLYDVLYSKGLYQELWFRPDGIRPLIIGKFDANPPTGMEQTIRSFFYFRRSQWPDERALAPASPDTAVFHPDGFPWIDWQKPQRLYGGDVMSVSPAQHPMIPFSDSYLTGSKNWGRGFTISSRLNDSVASTGDTFYRFVPGANDPAKVQIGANFDQEWKVAINTDPQMVFVTGWNQWIAIKQAIEQGTSRERIAFVDVYSEEYSNDIEPMRNGYDDAFYMQLISNIRKYKGITGDVPPSVGRTIDIHADSSQWNDVSSVYCSIGSQNYGRNSIGAALHGPSYTLPASRNNLQEIRVTHDSSNVYFYIKAESNITPHDSGQTNWVNIFVGTNEVAKQGWEGYDYVVNKVPETDGTTSIDKLDSTGNGETVGKAEYVINGASLQLQVPRASLGLPSGNSGFQCYFKVADGVQNEYDIMDYYVTGKSLPPGRLSHSYVAGSLMAIGDIEHGGVEGYSLSQNYPNPFNPSTEIRYSLPRGGMVTLKVYNILGQEVATLVNDRQGAGVHTVNFEPQDLASGVYMYRLQASDGVLSNRMVLLR